MYILKSFKTVSVDFVCYWIRGVIEYSSDAICNAFVCQFSVCTFNVDIPSTSGAICMDTRMRCYAYIL